MQIMGAVFNIILTSPRVYIYIGGLVAPIEALSILECQKGVKLDRKRENMK